MRELISSTVATWASFFANHPMVRTLIGFMHVGGLLANGGLLIRAERRAENDDSRGWPGLVMTSVTSLVHWFLTTLAGSGLLNIG